MYRRFKIFYLLLLFIPIAIFSQSKERIYNDGPYIFYNSDNSVRIISSDGFSSHQTVTKRLIDTAYSNINALGDIKVSDDKGKWVFSVKNSSLERNSNVATLKTNSPFKKGEKIFVISDSHGNFNNFISILKRGKVINDKLEWIYGKNRLVILGDTFDRGDDVLAILWLIYSLEEQAHTVGGTLTYLLGNHDNMVLKGDLRYIKYKYKKLQDTLGMPYNQFFSAQSHLGKWLRSKHTIEIIGNILFVHGGISPDFAMSGISIEQANEIIGKHIDTPKKIYDNALDIKDTLGMVKFLVGTNGPLWYRGLVSDNEKYNPISEKDLMHILKQYEVSRIIVGHTTFDGVTFHHNGKVISVDSEDEKRDIDHLAEGIEITGNKVRVVR